MIEFLRYLYSFDTPGISWEWWNKCRQWRHFIFNEIKGLIFRHLAKNYVQLYLILSFKKPQYLLQIIYLQ